MEGITKKAKVETKDAGKADEQEEKKKTSDPTAGVPRPAGPGTSKKALKRKAKKAAATAGALSTGDVKETKTD
jgi:hypothetical protein